MPLTLFRINLRVLTLCVIAAAMRHSPCERFPRALPICVGPAFTNGISPSRSRFMSDGLALKIRAELDNAFHRTHFGTANTVVTNINSGRITGTFLGPREIQLAARIVLAARNARVTARAAACDSR